MELKNYLEQEELNEGLFNKYDISKKADKLVLRLKRRKLSIERELETKPTKENKDLLRAITKSIPVIEGFRDYFIKLEKELENAESKEKELLIQAKYDDIKALFIQDLYKIMETVQYKPALFIGSLIAWIIFILATPFTNWMLIPTILSIKNINKNKKKITHIHFTKDLNKLTNILINKKRRQYRSYKTDAIEF